MFGKQNSQPPKLYLHYARKKIKTTKEVFKTNTGLKKVNFLYKKNNLGNDLKNLFEYEHLLCMMLHF